MEHTTAYHSPPASRVGDFRRPGMALGRQSDLKGQTIEDHY